MGDLLTNMNRLGIILKEVRKQRKMYLEQQGTNVYSLLYM